MLEAEIVELKDELKVAKTKRGEWTDPPSKTYTHWHGEVTRISQQLDRAQELLLVEKKQASQQASSSTAGTSSCFFMWFFPLFPSCFVMVFCGS